MAAALDAEELRMLECAICMNYPRNALESSCCYQVVCKTCVDEMHDSNNAQECSITCPLCRQENFSTSAVRGALKRLIDNISVECENGCGSMVKLGNITDHEKLCAKANACCKFCNILIPRHLFIEHLTSLHNSDVIDYCSFASNSGSEVPASGAVDIDPELFQPKVNSYGRRAKLGETGKFYCEGRLEFACYCCNGRCGPDNGCNCVGCQQLDIQARNLSKSSYINSQGCISFRDPLHQSFYCLRTVATNISPLAPRFVCDGAHKICRSCIGLNAAWSNCPAFRSLNS